MEVDDMRITLVRTQSGDDPLSDPAKLFFRVDSDSAGVSLWQSFDQAFGHAMVARVNGALGDIQRDPTGRMFT